MTKQEAKSLNLRIAVLTEELNDPLCQRSAAARKSVEESLQAARRQLAGM